jgi:hypothetical protein
MPFFLWGGTPDGKKYHHRGGNEKTQDRGLADKTGGKQEKVSRQGLEKYRPAGDKMGCSPYCFFPVFSIHSRIMHGYLDFQSGSGDQVIFSGCRQLRPRG